MSETESAVSLVACAAAGVEWQTMPATVSTANAQEAENLANALDRALDEEE